MSGYRESGVDLQAAARAVELIREVAAGASRPEVAAGVGGFAGAFRIAGGRLLVAATDGVGTKTEIARLVGVHDTLGIDLVAMCADDVVCTGAEPLFFLDYIAIGRVDPQVVVALVGGVADGCRQAGCALLGGETAEHPGVMEPDRFDLAGFCVGVVSDADLLGPDRVGEGDALIGLASSGLHSNGFSLVRRVLVDGGSFRLDRVPFGLERTLGEELLEPTRIYARLVVDLAKRGLLHSAAHITGGGLIENLPRALGKGRGAEMDASAWSVPPIFDLVRSASGASREDLYGILNMGLGMVLVSAPDRAEEIVAVSETVGIEASVVGRVVSGAGVTID